MGDTRTVNGQKQVYFLGFGWIDDNDEPNVAIFVDGDGDINIMVGVWIRAETKHSLSYAAPKAVPIGAAFGVLHRESPKHAPH